MKGGGLRFNQYTREWDPGNISGAEVVYQYSVDEADALNLLRIGSHPNMAQFWRNEFSNFVDRNIGSRKETDVIEAIKNYLMHIKDGISMINQRSSIQKNKYKNTVITYIIQKT